MKLPRRRYWVPLSLIVLFTACAKFDLHYHVLGYMRGDAYYRGLPTTYWRSMAEYQIKGPAPWRAKWHSWTRLPLPPKEETFDLFRGEPDADSVVAQIIDDQGVDVEIRIRAIWAISRDTLGEVVLNQHRKSILVRCLDDPNKEVRCESARTLLRVDEDVQSSAKVLFHIAAEKVKDALFMQRMLGANYLFELCMCRKVDPEPSLELLVKLQDDPIPSVRRHADSIVTRIAEVRGEVKR